MSYKYIDIDALTGSYQKEEEEFITEYSGKFIELFEKYKNNKEFSMIIWLIGARGSGKTTQEMMIADRLLETDKTRSVALFQAPEALLKAIQKALPKDKGNRFRIIDKLHEVINNDVILVDEGLDLMNAKESLTVELRNLGKSLSYSRHKRIFLIICSVTKGVFKDLRDMADMKIYKRLTVPFAESERSRDSFIKKYQFDLPNLTPDQSLFISTYKYFNCEGGLILDSKKYCPWYNDDISKNMAKESFDSDYKKQQKLQSNLKEIIEDAIKYFGKDLEKPLANRRVKGWLQLKYSHLYSDIRKYVGDIVNQAVFLLYEREKNKEEYVPELVMPSKFTIPSDSLCPEFFRNFYKENDKSDESLEIQTIIYHLLNGISQNQMCKDFRELEYNRVNNIVKKYNTGDGLQHEELRLAYVYEAWIASLTGGERDGGIGKPDIYYKDESGNVIGVGECKLLTTYIRSKVTFVQFSKNMDLYRLNTGYKYCKENGLKVFLLFFRIPNWGNFDICRIINVDDDWNEIIVERSDCREYVLDTTKFKKEDIFLDNIE